MATGITGIMATLDIAIKDFELTKIRNDRKLTILLTDYISIEKVFLQKSYNGENFTDAGEMLNNNSLASDEFIFIHAASSSLKIFYRAKCILHNGVEKYSKVIYCSPDERVQVMISPNPATDQLLIQNWPDSWPADVNFQVINLQGAKLWRRKMQVTNKSISLNLKNIPPGMYVIQAVSLQNESLMSERFVVGN
jgi:hypothetical protein